MYNNNTEDFHNYLRSVRTYDIDIQWWWSYRLCQGIFSMYKRTSWHRMWTFLLTHTKWFMLITLLFCRFPTTPARAPAHCDNQSREQKNSMKIWSWLIQNYRCSEIGAYTCTCTYTVVSRARPSFGGISKGWSLQLALYSQLRPRSNCLTAQKGPWPFDCTDFAALTPWLWVTPSD